MSYNKIPPVASDVVVVGTSNHNTLSKNQDFGAGAGRSESGGADDHSVARRAKRAVVAGATGTWKLQAPADPDDYGMGRGSQDS